MWEWGNMFGWDGERRETYSCKSDECSDFVEILTSEGVCDVCSNYTHSDNNNTECIYDTCNDIEEILLLNGTCYECDNYTHPDDENKNCVQDLCDQDA